MRKLEQTPLIYLALAATLASALTAQATGRTITTIVPANLGATAQFAASYPTSAAGNLGWYVMAGHQVGTVPVPIPGFTVNGSCRVNPAVLFQTFLFFMDGSGSSALSLSVPNSTAFAGFPFDIQTLDADLAASALSWGDNDVEVVVGPGMSGPLPSANMAAIPAGSFLMGSNAGTGWPYYSNDNERPVRQVTLTQPFWIGKYEVTQAEYLAVVGNNPSMFVHLNNPVEMVTWNHACAYCALLTTTERAAGRVPAGYQYRLPTEAEWEYCCRAGTVSEYYSGPTPLGTFTIGAWQTTNVGSSQPNAFGLYDMHGNCWEWCLDAWDLTQNYVNAPLLDPYVNVGPYRVFRGGGYYSTADVCRSAFRNCDNASRLCCGMGFRVVLAPALVP